MIESKSAEGRGELPGDDVFEAVGGLGRESGQVNMPVGSRNDHR